MANNGNLIQFTKETAAEMGRRGGIASGEAKRKRKSIAEFVKLATGSTIPDNVAAKLVKEFDGFTSEELTYGAAMVAKQISAAMKGDLNAAKWLQEMESTQYGRDLNSEPDPLSKAFDEFGGGLGDDA